MNKEIDLRGLPCPEPVINTKKQLKIMRNNERINVIVDNEAAKKNILRSVKKDGSIVKKIIEKDENCFIIEIMKQGSSEPDTVYKETKAASKAVGIEEPKKNSCGKTVFISSDIMGRGNDELGRILVKAFLFSLTEIENKPSTIVFMNTGVHLTSAGSDVVKHIKTLEKQGVEIIVCGTCLDYFELKDRLEVGTVSNMYDIAKNFLESENVITI